MGVAPLLHVLWVKEGEYALAVTAYVVLLCLGIGALRLLPTRKKP